VYLSLSEICTRTRARFTVVGEDLVLLLGLGSLPGLREEAVDAWGAASVVGFPGCGLDHDGDIGADEDRLALLQGGELCQEVLAEGFGGGLYGALVLDVDHPEDGKVATIRQDVGGQGDGGAG